MEVSRVSLLFRRALPHALPHVFVVLFFWLLTALYFFPLVFQGKVLYQHDIVQHVGAAQRLVSDADAQAGAPALWNPNMFGGMPAYLISVPWDMPVLDVLQRLFGLGLPHPTWILFSCLLCTYLLMLSLGARVMLAVLGAVAFAFSSYHIVGFVAGHNARLAAVSYMPLVLAGLHWVYEKKYGWGGLVFALGIAFELKSNHIQISYYTFFLCLFYVLHRLYYAWREQVWSDFLRPLVVLSVCFVVSFGTFFAPFATLYEHSRYTIRGQRFLSSSSGESKEGLSKAYAFQYSYALAEPLTLLVPNFYGGASQETLDESSHLARALRDQGVSSSQRREVLSGVPTYWGEQPITTPYYAGILMVLMAVWGLFFLRTRHGMWLLVGGLFFLLLSYGHHAMWFNGLLFDLLPGYNKFRSTGFALIVPVLCLVLWGVLALEEAFQQMEGEGDADRGGQRSKVSRGCWRAVLGVGGFLLLCVLCAGVGSYRAEIDQRLFQSGYPSWFISALRSDREALLRADAFRGLVFVLLFGGVMWALFREKMSKAWGMVLLTGLVFADLVLVDARYLKGENYRGQVYEKTYQETGADRRILSDRVVDTVAHSRVFYVPNPFNSAKFSYHHASVGGYHPAKLRRYQDLIDHHLMRERTLLAEGLRQGEPDFVRLSALNMLNTKYLVLGDKAEEVLVNPYACGPAWFVSEVLPVESADEEIQALRDLSVCSQAVVHRQAYALPAYVFDTLGTVRLKRHATNEVRYEATVPPGGGVLVFSEIHYPEWQAYVGGVPARMLRLNYLLRGLFLKEGHHEVVFRFEAKTYHMANRVSLFANYVLLCLVLLLLGRQLRAFWVSKPE